MRYSLCSVTYFSFLLPQPFTKNPQSLTDSVVDSVNVFRQFRALMYAVIETGGKQYRVQPGDIVQIEKLQGKVGSSVQFDQVLFCSEPDPKKSEIWLGRPYIDKAKVTAEIVGQGRGKKIVVFKFKRRKGYKRTQGHRQHYTQVLITNVENGSGKKQALSDTDKKAKLSKFTSLLKPIGPASQTKTLGSRIRLRGGPEKVKKEAPAKKKAVAKKAAAKKKKTAKKTAKKKAKKKTAKKK